MSHSDLGPANRQKRRAALARPTPGSERGRTAIGGEFHHYAGLRSKRRELSTRLLEKLGALIGANSASSHAGSLYLNQPGSNPGDNNRGIPAGYTYLYQLAAHDMVRSSFEPPFVRGDESPRNLRYAPLELDTIFGGGIAGCPHAYEAGPGKTHRLRMGKVRKDGSKPRKMDTLVRDLPRIAYNTDGVIDENTVLDIVLIADPRNDDNMILGQMTGLFHGLYNAVLTALEDHPTADQVARLIVIRLYRRILRHDLLPRLMHPGIYAVYEAGTGRLDPPPEEGSVSFEFAFAIARLAHAMVRDHYALNNSNSNNISTEIAISTSSQHNPKRVPIKRQDLIDWNLFFEPTEGSVPNRFNWAHRFGPHIAGDMTTSTAAEAPDDFDFQWRALHGTAFRDLDREHSMDLLRVSEIIEHIMANSPELCAVPDMNALLSEQKQKILIQDGLKALEARSNPNSEKALSDEDIEHLKQDPPLSLFCMFEAITYGTNGATMGPLASVMTGEAMWPIFHPASWEADGTEEDELELKVFGSRISNMPDLLERLKQLDPSLFAL